MIEFNINLTKEFFMKAINLPYTCFLLSAISMIPLIFIQPVAQAASDFESQCFEEVQGKIPWNEDKNMNWDAENVKQLCKGTSKPAEPGQCFNNILTGHVNWGKSTEWDWKNAIALCAGTNNAQESVSCFKSHISAGTDWPNAVLLCRKSHKANNVGEM